MLAKGLLVLAGWASTATLQAQEPRLTLPLPEGTAVVQTLQFPEGDRESVLLAEEVTPEGTRWSWSLVEVHTSGDTARQDLAFVEAGADVADAFRIRTFHGNEGPIEHPGYTMMAVSRRVYRQVRATGADSFQVMELGPPGGPSMLGEMAQGLLGRRKWVPTRWRGTLSLAAPAPAPFALLVNGRRTTVPALHLRGSFVARERRFEPQLWVLADSAYPLILKWIGHSSQPTNVLQTVRVDFPAGGTSPSVDLERTLDSVCRVELPGIYFAFNSALLEPASDRAIAALAEVLARHPDWTGAIEGHTDSVGSAAANRLLSERRAAAVRDRLVLHHKLAVSRLRIMGHGSSQPRESNATIEGRARNRRVELVRNCGP